MRISLHVISVATWLFEFSPDFVSKKTQVLKTTFRAPKLRASSLQPLHVALITINLTINRCLPIKLRSQLLVCYSTIRFTKAKSDVTTFAIHTHPFNGPFSRTTQVSRYQKGKTNLDFTGARDSEKHQLGRVQVCTSLQTDNHSNTPPLSFYRPDALPAAQPTASKHWRQGYWK